MGAEGNIKIICLKKEVIPHLSPGRVSLYPEVALVPSLYIPSFKYLKKAPGASIPCNDIWRTSFLCFLIHDTPCPDQKSDMATLVIDFDVIAHVRNVCMTFNNKRGLGVRLKVNEAQEIKVKI
ncbi:hypothetical protein H112_01638 [Trichophyton rubrum D6]|uniref:Uncharacterized protein n=2 Tax=Trichophyton TaxID=5550 RepID=A0A022WCK6_TRIRU|nr:hypothetical protein H100_01636 [Trichophyton rubrum MR850]EZF45221.1 hypothetical protein H102_01628 [Trichophyton rubrum CBS 100081]EZF55871.1 hypothetical protein H103_01642 [Trichophyton rubrum CBS 288.86]EZF66488.1 hypothetical protein H104_01617 [Trichophyton rubrum CBS 289.86]EZF77130.1 hypothetical protein H105_01644 [Trichophyton soudanense CBS 452.61]EZF87749.1 hypothetical protein H110_01640 [Trichophyton rubrum MR1448]EZG09515.1 hypothetical protein H106_01407 [Trichophyton rub